MLFKIVKIRKLAILTKFSSWLPTFILKMRVMVRTLQSCFLPVYKGKMNTYLLIPAKTYQNYYPGSHSLLSCLHSIRGGGSVIIWESEENSEGGYNGEALRRGVKRGNSDSQIRRLEGIRTMKLAEKVPAEHICIYSSDLL